MNTTPPTVLFGEIDIERLVNCLNIFNYFKVSDEIEICTYSSQEHFQTCINTNANSIKDLDLIVQIPNDYYLLPTANQSNESMNTLLILKKIDSLLGEDTKNLLLLMLSSNLIIHSALAELIGNHLKSIELRNKNELLQTLSLRIWCCQLMHDIVDEISQRLNPDDLMKYKQDDIRKIKDLANKLRDNFQLVSPSLNEMAERVEMSPTKFKNIFKDVLDKSPHQFILDLRLNHAQKLLRDKELTISQIAYKVGFNHPSALTRLFKNKLGISPNEVSQRR